MADEDESPASPGSGLKRISRREFARHAALAAATVAAMPDKLMAEPGPATSPAALPAGQQTTEEPKLSPESRAEVEAKIQAIFRRYGQRLTEEQKADVKRLVAEGQKALESLRAFPLDNADAPATVLRLYPESGYDHPPMRAPKAPARPGKE